MFESLKYLAFHALVVAFVVGTLLSFTRNVAIMSRDMEISELSSLIASGYGLIPYTPPERNITASTTPTP